MTLSRRRTLAVVAAAAFLGGSTGGGTRIERRFRALGTEARLTLIGDRGTAEVAIAACRAEIAAIERAFSLWQPDSEIMRLNRIGWIADPSHRFVELAGRARRFAALTRGAFDPTVQGLWSALARGDDPALARGRIDWRALSVRDDRIAFERPGMAATFNGIAQGYGADRVAAVLYRHGFRSVLVDLGEFRAAAPPDARRWRIGVRDPAGGGIADVLEVGAGAVATSEPGGTLIAGRSHLFDPLDRTGPRWRSVTVLAAEAWRADALSTAVAASPVGDADFLLLRGGAQGAVLIDGQGGLRHWSA